MNLNFLEKILIELEFYLFALSPNFTRQVYILIRENIYEMLKTILSMKLNLAFTLVESMLPIHLTYFYNSCFQNHELPLSV